MSEFSETWELTRKRFDDAVSGLSQDQLNWRLQPGSLTLGESALHVAGVELSFVSQLLGETLDAEGARISACSTEGVINPTPFPFDASEITPDLVQQALDRGRRTTHAVLENPSDEIRHRQIKSALGPMIDGNGAFARLAYHAGYHQGQAHLIKTAPGFPENRS
jgi:hypothetical protein